MQAFLGWSEVDEAMDRVEEGDRDGAVAVFLSFEGRALETRDGRGARQTVNVSSFCQHFGIYRATFSRWLHNHNIRETA